MRLGTRAAQSNETTPNPQTGTRGQKQTTNADCPNKAHATKAKKVQEEGMDLKVP